MALLLPAVQSSRASARSAELPEQPPPALALRFKKAQCEHRLARETKSGMIAGPTTSGKFRCYLDVYLEGAPKISGSAPMQQGEGANSYGFNEAGQAAWELKMTLARSWPSTYLKPRSLQVGREQQLRQDFTHKYRQMDTDLHV